MNKAYILYCYPTSPMAEQLGKSGYYCRIGNSVYSPVFVTLFSVESWCEENGIKWEPHAFPRYSPSI